MKVYIKPVDDKHGLFWEDGVPIYEDDPSEPYFVFCMIRVWKYPGWAKRYAEKQGWELMEAPEQSKQMEAT